MREVLSTALFWEDLRSVGACLVEKCTSQGWQAGKSPRSMHSKVSVRYGEIGSCRRGCPYVGRFVGSAYLTNH